MINKLQKKYDSGDDSVTAMKTNLSFWKSGHLPTLFSAFLYFDVSFMIWVMLGALGNYIAGDLHLNPAQKGLMTAIPLLGGSILRLVFGQLTDRIGPRKAGCIGLMLTLLPLLGGWLWADSIGKIYAIGLLLGVAGASFAVALPMASRWYPPKYQGLALGIAGAGNSGTILATFFAPRLAESLGWHAVFGLAILPLLLAAIVFVTLSREAPGLTTPASGADFLAVLAERDTYLFSLFYGVTFGGFVGLASFLSILLHDQYGISKVAAGDLTSLCVISGSFLRPVGGWLADRLGGIRMLSILYGAAALLALGVAQLPALWLAMILLFFLMGCLGIGNGSVFQLVPQRYGKRVGIATGILGAAGGLGGFFLPTIVGSLKQLTGSYAGGLVVLAGLAITALAALAVAQTEWIGVWIGRHGRAKGEADVSSSPEAAPDYKILSGTQG
ncbi:MAG TPA: nitrate/nitrite transporter [Verrucomicrobiae bacterium]|jgi:NNP family nitrate/nitrite transporter-like MFS transporter|nr:nitrate/nitrite transporter [Verrucomicrobiae bacterium]